MQSLKAKTKEQLSLSADVRVIRVIDKIFNFAIGCEAEEIYFEPKGNDLAVNFKAGGEVINTLILPGKAETAVLDGIKSMAGLNDQPGKYPQGKFKKDYLGYKIIFSLNVHDTAAGEKIVVDLRRERFELLGLGRLGLNARAFELVKKIIEAGKGLVAVIGDDESCRISTLYSLMNFLKNKELNIASVEREISADLPGVNQSRVNPRIGFNSGAAVNALRRQDIDAAMISEVDDRETAEAALNLAAAHHLVLAGIHGADFLAVLNLLQDLGAPLPLFSSAAKLVINCRMIEKNCPHCLVREKIGPTVMEQLKKKLALATLLPRLREDRIISEKIRQAENLVFYQSRGCARCQNSGREGKIGVFEVLEITATVKGLIKTGHYAAIKEEFSKQKEYSLAEDALIKALSGLITVEDVLEIIG